VPSFGRSDLFDPVVPPKSTHATESWDAAFGAHSCPGENEDAIVGENVSMAERIRRPAAKSTGSPSLTHERVNERYRECLLKKSLS